MELRLDRTFAALADPTRRAILTRLTRGEASVSELGKPFAISQPAISKHLRVLEEAGLIEAGQAGPSRPRRIRREALRQAQDWVAQVEALWRDSFDRLDAMLASDQAGGGDRS